MGPKALPWAPDFLDIDEFEHRLEVDQREVDDHPEPISNDYWYTIFGKWR